MNPEGWPSALRDALPVAERVLTRLNEQAGTRYRPVRTHVKRISRLLRDGYSEQQMRAVVWHRCELWKDDAKQRIFLRPSTLFGPEKFAEYIGLAEAELERRQAKAGKKPTGNGEMDWGDLDS